MSEEEKGWLNTNPGGALRTFTNLCELADNTLLDFGIVNAIVYAIEWVAGKANVMAWPDARAELLSFVDTPTTPTVGALRRVVDVVAMRMNEPRDLVARKCSALFQFAAVQRLVRERPASKRKVQSRREAIIPAEKMLNMIMRYRPHLERTRDRALANLKRDQRAGSGNLPPPIRIQLQGDGNYETN